VPAAVATILAPIFGPGEAAPVAYIAGVAGPLIGADLLHLKEIEQSAVGMAISAEPGLSTASSSRALLLPIWHDRSSGGLDHPAIARTGQSRKALIL
jgi:hypothetical protein